MNLCCSSGGRGERSRNNPDSWKKVSERPSMQTLSPERQHLRTDEIALKSFESRNLPLSTLTSNNDLRIDVYHNESGMVNPNWRQNSRMSASHYSNPPVQAQTDRNRQGNGYHASVDKNRPAFEMKQHYVDKIYKLQLERSDMKTALAKTVKENQDRLGKCKRDAVKKDRAHDVLSYQLDDTRHRLEQMKKDANIKSKALESEIEQLEKANYDLRKRIENEIHNSKLALVENETLKQHLHSTGNDLVCCKTKLRKCQEDLQSEREKYTSYQLHESQIGSLRHVKNDFVANKEDLEKINSQLNAEICELKKRIEHDKKARLQKVDHNLRAQFETNDSNIQLEKHKLDVCIADLESKLDQMKKDIVILKKGYESDCNAIQNKLHRKENELKETKLELENSKRRYSEVEVNMNNEIAGLRSKLDDADATLLQMKKEARETMHTMKNEKKDANTRMQKRSEEELKLRNENVDLRTKLADMEQSFHQTKQNAAGNIKALENEALSVKWNQTHTQIRIDELSKENEELRRYIDQQKYTFENQLKETIESNNLRQQLRSSEMELENANIKIQKLAEYEQEIRNENEGLRSQLAEAEQTLQQTKQKATEDVKALEFEKSHIVTKFNNEAFSVQRNQTDIDIRIDQLSTENENLKRNITQQRTTFDYQLKEAIESNNHMQRLQSSEIELENANAKLHQCQEDLHSVRETNAYYKTQSESKIAKLQQITNELETSKAHLQKENSKLNTDIIQLRKENDQLKRQENDNITRHCVEDYDALQNKLHHTEKILEQTELELGSIKPRLYRCQEDLQSVRETNAYYTTQSESQIVKLQQDTHELETSKAHLQKENNELNAGVFQLRKENDQLKRQENDYITRHSVEDYDAQQNKLHHTENILKQTELELESMKTRLHKDALSSKTLYDSKIAKLLQEKHGLETCNADLEKNHDQMTIDINNLKQRLESDQKKGPSFADYDALQQKLNHKVKELKQTELELEDTKTRLHKDTFSSETLYDSKIVNLVQAKHDLEACKADLEMKNNQMKIDINNLQQRLASDQKRRHSFADYDAFQQTLHRTEKDLKQTELELEDTKTRLSKSMGDKLTNNNPNIVDLSDMNRPSKLADRYKELYDNQWTDAYEILENTETEEERIIYILLTILIETKRFCDAENRIQMEETLKAITHSDKVQMSDIPVGVIKYIKDCRKSSSAQDIKIKYEKYMSEMRKGSYSFAEQALAINEYLNECFEICWLMSIQDPPVVVSPLLKHGVSFRTDLYSAYTVSGKLVDYSVWPALLLHENGPTLTKGVAQGMKRA